MRNVPKRQIADVARAHETKTFLRAHSSRRHRLHASLVDALACLTFLFLQVSSTNVGRLYIASLVDPITCLIGYWVFFRRLRSARPILADLGFCNLVLGTFFLTCANAVEELGNLHSLSLRYVSAMEVDALLELLASLTLPFGLAIYAWLIASSPPLRRWLGFMIGIQVVILFVDPGAFNIPRISEFVTAVYAIILSLAKAVWFLSPVVGSKSCPLDHKQMKMGSDQKQNRVSDDL